MKDCLENLYLFLIIVASLACGITIITAHIWMPAGLLIWWLS